MKDTHTSDLSERETSVELLPALISVFRYWWLILLTGLVFSLCTYISVKLFVAPQYASEFTIYVSNRGPYSEQQNAVSTADLTASRNLASTYAEIINGRSVLEQASVQADLPFSYEELCDMITVSSVKDTEIISVSVITSSPVTSLLLAQSVADVAINRVSGIMSGGSMQILDGPEEASHPCAPNGIRVAVCSGAFGVVACICVLLVLYILDIRVNTDTLNLRFDLPVFECIPEESLSKENAESIQEAYRALRTNVAFSLTGNNAACIAITCDECLSDKSNAAINLAVTFAQSGKKVLLIDCDMQKKTLTNILVMGKQTGLSDVLIGNASLENVYYRDIAGVDILSAGRGSAVPKMLLESGTVDLLVQKAKEKYDYIFLDLASMNNAADAVVMARCSDGFLLVLRQNKTKNKSVEKMLGKLTLAGGKILGFIVYGTR